MKRYSFRTSLDVEAAGYAEPVEDSQGEYYSVWEVDQHLTKVIETSAELRAEVTGLAEELAVVAQQYQDLLLDYRNLVEERDNAKCGRVCPRKKPDGS